MMDFVNGFRMTSLINEMENESNVPNHQPDYSYIIFSKIVIFHINHHFPMVFPWFSSHHQPEMILIPEKIFGEIQKNRLQESSAATVSRSAAPAMKGNCLVAEKWIPPEILNDQNDHEDSQTNG